MPVRDQIEAATGTERQRLKAQAFADYLADTAERTFTLPNGWSVAVASPALKMLNGAPVLRFLLTVTRPNGRVQFDDEVVVINPPILVPDRTEANPDYDATRPGSSPTRTVFREDLRAALREIVRGVVVR